MAVATDPRNLYDDYAGCYVDGKNGVVGRGSKVASNLNMDWERPVNFEYLTADGRMVINQEAGFEVAGGYSRHFAPASFKVQAKKLYDGKGTFDSPVFAGKPYCKYKQLLVRNGGNNNRMDGGPRIKDAVTQQVLTSSGYYVDAQEYQPVHVFINGKYVAMMNVREPNNRFHGSPNYGYDDDRTDGFEYSGRAYWQRGGDREAFDRLVDLSKRAATEEGYAEVCGLLDMEEFVRYMAAICYTGSYDWVLNGNNVKGYRTREDGKFHFVFFDQDLTWENTNNVELIDGVTKNEVLTLYNNLKRNRTFARQFVTSYAILHGSVYTPERCRAVADSICALVEEALSFDNRRATATYNKLKKQMWGDVYRGVRVRALRDVYHLTDSLNVTVGTNNAAARLRLNGQTLPCNHFAGTLFGEETLTAESAEGYVFVGWQDRKGAWITHDKKCAVTGSDTYTAVYGQEFQEGVPPVCINEVSAANDIFVNDYGKRADWIELYNRSQEPIDVAGLYFSDDRQDPMKYRVDAAPEANTVVQPDGHIVVWCDGKTSRTQPHLPFKLKNVENGFLSLQPADGSWKDTLKYGVHTSKESIGRYPDGGMACYQSYHPTIGRHNMLTQYDTCLSPGMDVRPPQSSSEDIVSVAYYTLDGKRVQPQNNGIYIRVTYYQDGHSRASKILINE